MMRVIDENISSNLVQVRSAGPVKELASVTSLLTPTPSVSSDLSKP